MKRWPTATKYLLLADAFIRRATMAFSIAHWRTGRSVSGLQLSGIVLAVMALACLTGINTWHSARFHHDQFAADTLEDHPETGSADDPQGGKLLDTPIHDFAHATLHGVAMPQPGGWPLLAWVRENSWTWRSLTLGPGIEPTSPLRPPRS